MAYKNPLDERARAARRKHYQANKDQYLRRNQEDKQAKREWLAALKESTPCADCKKRYPSYVMDFDHLDPSTKLGTVARLVNDGNWKKLKDEIEKCEIVCSNCHRIRTHGKKMVGA